MALNRDKLAAMSSDQKDELILKLLANGDIVQDAVKAYRKQVQAMASFMKENDLVSLATLQEKDDKTWDRGKFIMDNLDKYVDKLSALEDKLLPTFSAPPKTHTRKGAITEFIDVNKK